MAKFIVGRLLVLVPVLFAASIIVFLILNLAPGDPALAIAGSRATPEEVENVRQYFHLDDPLYVQYGAFVVRAIQGDFGQSLRTRRPVLEEIGDRLPASMQLAGASLLVAILIGVPAGVLSATRQYSVWDNVAMVIAVLGVSMPVFWLGLLLIVLFGVQLGWLPTGGNEDWRGLILPAGTLGFSSAAIVARQTRSAMLEVLRQDYIRTAHAKGLPHRVILLNHALRNAAIPVVTVLGLQLGHLLGGAVITETVFAWPGLGRLVLESVGLRDIPVVQGGVLVLATVFVLVNLAVDVVYGYLDPRIQLA